MFFFLFSSCGNEEVESLKNRVGALESDLNDLKDEIKSNTQFEKGMQCQEMLDRLKKRWSNIVGCYYSPDSITCMVKFKKNGIVEEARIEDLQDD